MTLSPFWTVFLAVASTIAIAYGSFLTYRASRAKQRSDSGMQKIDQHQEDIQELRTWRTEDRARITNLERQIRVQGDYIGELRRHIADGRPPPPPPYPTGLIT